MRNKCLRLCSRQNIKSFLFKWQPMATLLGGTQGLLTRCFKGMLLNDFDCGRRKKLARQGALPASEWLPELHRQTLKVFVSHFFHAQDKLLFQQNQQHQSRQGRPLGAKQKGDKATHKKKSDHRWTEIEKRKNFQDVIFCQWRWA